MEKVRGSDENRAIWRKIKRDAPVLAEFMTSAYARFGKLTLRSVTFHTISKTTY